MMTKSPITTIEIMAAKLMCTGRTAAVVSIPKTTKHTHTHTHKNILIVESGVCVLQFLGPFPALQCNQRQEEPDLE